MASLGELFIELGVLGDDEGAKKVAKAIEEAIDKTKEYAKQQKQQEKQEQNNAKSSGNLAKNIKNVAVGLGGVITAVSGAVIALNKLAESLVQQNQQWINLTRNSDIALSTFQKWGQVGAAMNASLGEMGAAGAIADLNEKLFALKLTGEGARGFQLAGIMPTNAEDVMEQLRDRIKGLSDTSATYLLKQMGIDPRMLSVLRMTREEFNSLTKELEKYQLTMEQRQQIQEFHKQMSIVNVKMQYFKDRILISLLPHIERIMKFVIKIVEALPKFRGYIIAFALIGSKIKPVAAAFSMINKSLIGWLAKLPIIGRMFGVLGGAIAKAFLPLTAAYLLLEDFAVFQEGGDSVIGDIVNYFKEISDDWVNIGKIFTTKPLKAFLSALALISDMFTQLFQRVLNFIDTIFGTPFGKWMQKWLNEHDYEEKLQQLKDDLKYDAERINQEKIAKNIVPSNVYNNGGNDNSKNVTNNITINSQAGAAKVIEFLKQNPDYPAANLIFNN